MTCAALTLITRSVAPAFQFALLLVSVTCAALLCHAADVAKEQPNICVVIRTYWGHGGETQEGLRSLIQSLQRQQNQKWEAIIVVLDSRSFPDLPHILQSLNDDRVWTFAEWIGPEFAARTGSAWAPAYHSMLYNLTDEALRACPRNTEWVVMTNGDNEYSSTFFAELEQHPEADLVAMDYYSRYQRPTALPCQRFAAEQGKPLCKQNLLKWCHTDLGANAYKWPRLIQEDHRFSQLGPVACGLPAEHYDGVLVHRLIDAGWQVEHVQEQCLYDHNPSPQRCARTGGVWDDSNNVWEGGGSCVTQEEAAQKLQDPAARLQEVVVRLSNDGQLDAFGNGTRSIPSQIRCLMQQDVAAQHAQMMDYFGPTCTAAADEEYVKGLMGARWIPQDWSCIGTSQQLQLQHRKEVQHHQQQLHIPLPPDPLNKSRTPSYRRRYEPALVAERDEL